MCAYRVIAFANPGISLWAAANATFETNSGREVQSSIAL